MQDKFDLPYLNSLVIREPELVEWGISVSADDLLYCRSVAQMISRLHEIYADSKGKTRWGQKTPRFVRHLELLAENFPGSKTIHMVRDPRAVVSSLIQSNVHRSNAYHGSQRWKMDVSAGLKYESNHRDRVLRIFYENLVKSPEDVLKEISAFLELDPSEMSVKGDEKIQEYSTFYESIHANIERSPTTAFIDKWRQQLSQEEVAVVEAICGELMGDLGYERSSMSISTPTLKPRKALSLRVRGILQQMGRYLMYRRSYLFHLIWRKWKLGLLKDFLWTINY